MLDKSYLLPAEALNRVLSAVPERQGKTERLKIEECYGRILASSVAAPEDLPAFARSTVDGYAVRSSDTFGARESLPAYLSITGEVFMGAAPGFSVGKGEGAKIPTGGMLPSGADAVVMLEHAETVSGDTIEVMKPAAPHENVIRSGEDVEKGMLVLTRGRLLRPQDIGALAGLGITETDVFAKPVVALISTGDEIVPPDRAVRPGQVRDINSFTLAGLIRDHGGAPIKKGIFSDEYGAIRGAVEEALAEADMVLISGGTSAGVKDMTSTIIDDSGKPGVLFHGVSLKPGKPMIGGVVGGTPVFGLPGHPAAAVVCFDLFILPLLERLNGLDTGRCFPGTVRAQMAKSIASSAGREDHIRVALEWRDGALLALPVLGKSGLITTLVKADGTVVIPPGKPGLDAGEEVAVRLF
ncbi:MAG: gephyrin-like molybdotransferase Glp [Thermodesulfovibrionales bacterium]